MDGGGDGTTSIFASAYVAAPELVMATVARWMPASLVTAYSLAPFGTVPSVLDCSLAATTLSVP